MNETHLDQIYEDSALLIQGYNIYMKDFNKYGGGVAFYVRETLPVRIRTDLMIPDIEAPWLQIQIPYWKSLFIACFYRPPNAYGFY